MPVSEYNHPRDKGGLVSNPDNSGVLYPWMNEPLKKDSSSPLIVNKAEHELIELGKSSLKK